MTTNPRLSEEDEKRIRQWAIIIENDNYDDELRDTIVQAALRFMEREKR